MKIKCMKIDWLVPLVGAAVVAGCLMAVNTYLGLERRIQAEDTLATTLDHLCQDQKLSVVLKKIHNGAAAEAAQNLDLILCASILRLSDGLASADPQTRAYVEDAFRRIARVRPMTGAGAAGSAAQDCNEDQVAAERVLMLALASDQRAQTR
jgi:hypothetical protein